MSAIGVVIARPLREQLFTPADQAALEALAPVRWWEGAEPPGVPEAVELLADCRIGIGSWGSPHPGQEGLLAGCPDLALWEHVAGSVKAMFTPHSAGRDLVIGTCKGAIADCVAEMTLGEIICGLRQVWQDAAAQRAGRRGKPPGLKVLPCSTVGVIGASEVGKRVIALLRPFGCQILLADPFIDEATARELGAELVADPLELCRRSDAVTLHTPLLPSTTHLLRREHFQAMADDTVIINTSRGPCLQQEDLEAELQQGRLFAFLDVTDPEPCPADSPLRSLPNVVLTSHTAGPATFNMGRQCVADVAAFLAGGQPACTVTADMLERIA